MYLMRFDLRAPDKTAQERAALHRTAIEMAAWADEHGCTSIVVSEHHASEDGYLPSPIPLAAAMAAVTSSTPIVGGRRAAAASTTRCGWPRTSSPSTTSARAGRWWCWASATGRSSTSCTASTSTAAAPSPTRSWSASSSVLRDAGRATDAAAHHAAPVLDPMPLLAWGGRSKAAARRAGRNGLDFFAQGGDRGAGRRLRRRRHRQRARAGHVHDPRRRPRRSSCSSTTTSTPGGRRSARRCSSTRSATTTGTRRPAPPRAPPACRAPAPSTSCARRAAHRVVSTEVAAGFVRDHGPLGLHPLCGGLDPEVAWPYLRRAVAAANGALAG